MHGFRYRWYFKKDKYLYVFIKYYIKIPLHTKTLLTHVLFLLLLFALLLAAVESTLLPRYDKFFYILCKQRMAGCWRLQFYSKTPFFLFYSVPCRVCLISCFLKVLVVVIRFLLASLMPLISGIIEDCYFSLQ